MSTFNGVIRRRNLADTAPIGKILPSPATMTYWSYRLPRADLEEFIDFF
jgi:methionine synthase II (cobalamin-independent)